MKFGVINLSTVVSASDAQTMVAACQLQLTRDVAPAWDRAAPSVGLYADEQAAGDACLIAIHDSGASAGALGWHAESPLGRPFGRVFSKPVLDGGGTVLHGYSLSAVLSHELIEAMVDPFVNIWIDGPGVTEGACYSYEACDPVEEDTYPITVGGQEVTVSNFVWPDYFNSFAVGRQVDQMKSSPGPFCMAKGGYQVVRKGQGSEIDVFAEHEDHDRIIAKMAHPSSRTHKRCFGYSLIAFKDP